MKINKDDLVEVFDSTKKESILYGQIVSIKNETHVWFRYQIENSLRYRDIKFIKQKDSWVCEHNISWVLSFSLEG